MICQNKLHLSCMNLVASVILITMAVAMLPVIPLVRADSSNPGIYPIDSKPFGLTYGEWSAKWWQWLLPIPKDINPTQDGSGINCAQGQNDQHVWFLAGTGGGAAQRTCTIPAGKAILFPVLNSECTYKDSATSKTPADLRKCAIAGNAGVTILEATVDGRNIHGVEGYRVTSDLFNVTDGNNNIQGVNPGPTQGVSDGWWFMLSPFPTGNHQVHFAGVIGGLTPAAPTLTSTNPSFASEVTYHLAVK